MKMRKSTLASYFVLSEVPLGGLTPTNKMSSKRLLAPLIPIPMMMVTMITMMITVSVALPSDVKIGGLFTKNSSTAMNKTEMAFLHAIDRINAVHLIHGSKLFSVVNRVEAKDSFHASKKVCSMVNKGVLAIFGPQSSNTASHVQSVAKALEIPHMETRMEFREERSNFSLNFYPHPSSLSKAYFDLINKWKWKSFALIYEDNQGLVRMQELLKANYNPKIKIFIRQLKPGRDYGPLLKEVKKSGETRIILDCSTDKIIDILKQAQELGLMTHYHNFLLTSLDFHTLDLHEFHHIGTNITAFRLVNPDSAVNSSEFARQIFGMIHRGETPVTNGSIPTDAALMFDAVVMFAMALNGTNKNNIIEVQKTSCESGSSAPWIFGNGIIQLMIHMQMNGLTGNIKFDKNDGFRKEFNLDIVTLRNKSLQKIGNWNISFGVDITQTFDETVVNMTEYFKKYKLRVTTKLSDPYVRLKSDSKNYSGVDMYEGFCVDLMKEIAKICDFSFTIQLVKDKSYGTWNKVTGEWDGVIKELIEQEADIGIGDLTVTYDREQAVDFTMPFMNLGINILFKKPNKKEPVLFSFLSPLDVNVWMYMITAYLGVSVSLFLLARVSPMEWSSPHPCDDEPEELETQFSLANCMWFAIGSLMQQGCDFLPKFNPYDWENPHPCDPDPDELENKFTLLNSMWFTIGSLMQQGSDIAPKAISTRLVAGIWWFFTLIMISSYTANLAAFLTIERMVSPINSVEDLAAQTKIKYGCVKTGTTLSFFKESNLAVYQTMWTVMESNTPSVFTDNNQEGVERVKKGGYAYIIESTANEYYTERNCDLTRIGGLLDSKSYGIATPPGSPFRALLSSAILKLQGQGTLHMLKEAWWKKGGMSCAADEKVSSSANELGLANVGGVFVVLLAGLGVACIVGILEFVWKTRKTVREERSDFWEELKRELRFASQCKGNKKPVAKKLDIDTTMTLPLTNYQ